MKILVYINEVPKQYLLIEKKTTIYSLKKALENLAPEESVEIKMFVNSKNELKVFDTNNYDNLNFESTWKHIRNPVIYLTTKRKEANFSNLPKDIKKLIIYEMSPKDALVVCNSQIGFECDWQKLLDLNYDFVTQGFALLDKPKEKFRYLAERVSKNINVTPEIIFVHFNGIPLGKKRFLEIHGFLKEEDIMENIEDDIEERKNDMTAVFKTLSKDKSVEWVKQDDYNMWIKVKNPDKLPNEIVSEIRESGGYRHRKILRDNDLYDYPESRKMEGYPGKVELYTMKKTDILETIKKVLIKILKMGYDDEEESEEIIFDLEEFKEEIQEYFNEGNFDDKTHEYSVYIIMRNGFTRTEAELLMKAYSWKVDDFLNNLKKLYGFDFNTMM